MHACVVITIRTDQYGRHYQDGALVDYNGRIVWQCGHGHYTTVYNALSQSALDCAEYERSKR